MQVNDKLIKQSKVLWENPNPSANFVEQTISLDLTKYRAIEISFNTAPAMILTIGSLASAVIRIQDSNGIWTGAWFLDVRRVDVNSSGVIFYDNRGQSTNQDNAYSVRNHLNKPLKIIGYLK